jgi:hypothetical protein
MNQITLGVRPLLVALVLAVVNGACSSDTPTPDPAASPVVATTTRDGVKVTLTLEGPPRTGALSWAGVRIENLGPKAVRWAGGGCGDPAAITIDLRSAFAAGRDWPGRLGQFKRLALGVGPADPRFQNPAAGFYIAESRVGQNLVCTADLRIEELAAGTALAMRAAWDGALGSAAPAPVGPAAVSASFPFVGISGAVANDKTDTSPIESRVDATVIGAPGAKVPSSPALAIDAALADPDFASWVNAADQSTWINPSVSFKDGVWGIGLFRVGAGDQHEMFGEVKVDAAGQIVGRRFEP